MNTNCPTGTHCWGTCIGFFILWWLISSGLLTITWNKIIGAVAKTKPVKYWQSAAFIFSLCFIVVIPGLCMKRYAARGYGMHHDCHHGMGSGMGDCPYSGDKKEAGKAGDDKDKD